MLQAPAPQFAQGKDSLSEAKSFFLSDKRMNVDLEAAKLLKVKFSSV
jgi:hypothetical protein